VVHHPGDDGTDVVDDDDDLLSDRLAGTTRSDAGRGGTARETLREVERGVADPHDEASAAEPAFGVHPAVGAALDGGAA
jgi:hypothetical protein